MKPDKDKVFHCGVYSITIHGFLSFFKFNVFKLQLQFNSCSPNFFHLIQLSMNATLLLHLSFVIVSGTWIVLVPRHLLEAVVQRQVVSDRVLPASFALLIKGEVVGDVLINLAQGQLLLVRILDGHGYERGVGVGRPDQLQQLFLAGDGQPAQVGPTKARWVRYELPLRAVWRRDERRRVVSVQVGRGWVDARPVEPQVRVRRWCVISEAVAGGSLCALQALLVVHAAKVVAVDSGHVRGLLGAFGWERANGRGGVLVVLVMGLRVDGVHHSPREIPKEMLKRFRWPVPVARRQLQQVSGRSSGSFNSINPRQQAHAGTR